MPGARGEGGRRAGGWAAGGQLLLAHRLGATAEAPQPSGHGTSDTPASRLGAAGAPAAPATQGDPRHYGNRRRPGALPTSRRANPDNKKYLATQFWPGHQRH